MLRVRSQTKWNQSPRCVSGRSHKPTMLWSRNCIDICKTGSGRSSWASGNSWSAELRAYCFRAYLCCITYREFSFSSKDAACLVASRIRRSFSGHISGQTPCVLTARAMSVVVDVVRRISLSLASKTRYLEIQHLF